MLSNDLFLKKDDVSKVDVKVLQAIKQMDQVNHINWQYLVVQSDGTEKAINDFESMLIG